MAKRKPVREQVELELDGNLYRVVPTFETLDMMEQRLSCTMFFQRLERQDVRVSELAWAEYSALVCQGISALEYGDIGEIIIAEGLPKHIEQVTALISSLLNVGPETPPPAAPKGGSSKNKGKAKTGQSRRKPTE